MPSLIKAGQFRQVEFEDGFFYRVLQPPKPAEPEPVRMTEQTEDPQAAEKALEAERQAAEERALRERLREESRRQGYEEGQQAGYQDGYQTGFEAGHREATAQVLAREQEEIERLAAHYEDLTDACNDWLHTFQERSVELALAIAEKVLQTKLQESPEYMEELAARVLHAHRDKNPRVLMVSPDMRERLMQSERFRRALDQMPVPVEIQGVDALDEGGLILDTPECRIDAGVDTQLSRIRRGLVELTDEV